MKTQRLVILLIFLAALIGAFLWGRHSGTREAVRPAAASQSLYTCGMHPQVVRNQPGNCPICGMTLTPVRTPSDSAAAVSAPGSIQIDAATIQTMGLRTTTVRRGALRRVIRAPGVVDYDETRLTEVTTKIRGWIGTLYVNATGQWVRQGDPLFEFYAPELYSAQVEYLLATAPAGPGEGGQGGLKDSARMKLKFLDVSDDQIAALDQSRQPRKTLRIMAPRDGFVIEKRVIEGQMVESGTSLYRLADLGVVWIQAQVYEQDLAYLKPGQEATVRLDNLPDREFHGEVTTLYPTVDEKTRTARVRLELPNPGYLLKPGLFATVQILAELKPLTVLIPDMAILRSGEKTTVFVALPGGTFEPRRVRLGPQAEEDTYEVLEGLKEGERIVTSGQFMLDSESQLREAIQKMAAPAEQGRPATPAGTPALSPRELYTCPMPEDAEVVSDTPGVCPKCGMALVATRTVPHGASAEAAWRRQHPSAAAPFSLDRKP